MQNSRQNQDQSPAKTPHVNIAGDFSGNGIEVSPDAINEQDFETEADELGEMQDIAPKENDQGGITKRVTENERATRESLKSSTAGQSTRGQNATTGIVNPSSNKNVNTDWPVDE